MYYKKIVSDRLKGEKRLFYNFPSFGFSFFPYLVSSDYYILAGPTLKKGIEVNCLIVEDVKEEIESIIKYQQDLLRRNIGFDDKIFFLYNVQRDFDFFYNVFNLPENKISVVKCFCSLKRDVFLTLLEKGISTLREAEYFCLLDERLKNLLLESNISRKEFKLALNICFEITKLKLPLPHINSNDVFDVLLKIRYPEFYRYKSRIDGFLEDLRLKNIQIDFDKFFEGRRLKIIAQIKSKEDFLNYLKTVSLEKDKFIKIIDSLSL